MVDFHGGPVAGNLDVRWVHGAPQQPATEPEPPIQIHPYDPHTFLMRQSKRVSFEAPFLYLLFGNERALLIDTGATKDPAQFPLRSTVDTLTQEWLATNGIPSAGYEVVVAHTHGHGDHVAADEQFADRPDTTVVGTDVDSVRSYFRFSRWPDEIVNFDLGGRTVELTGIPGHHPSSVAVFDPWTGFLLTGDTVYPGRLYAFDMPAYVASLDRLVAFAEARPVTHVMGCHIEMSRRPGLDYPMGARYQPEEPPLQMTVAQLRAVRDAAHAAAATPGFHVHDEFILFNGAGRFAPLKLIARSIRQRLRLAPSA